MTLASILIRAGRAGERVSIAEVRERLQLSEEELYEDVNVLNVVNFGGGSYVLYAEIDEQAGEIEVDPEPYSDNFDRPARLLPVEAKALVAAIDLIGEHIPEGSLASAREKIVAALGEDPMEQGLQVASAGGDDALLARRDLGGDRRQQAGRARVLQGERGRSGQAHGGAVRADERTRGLVCGLVRPAARRHAPLPPGPHQAGDDHRADVRAAGGGRPGGGGRRLAAHGRGRGLAHGARVGGAGAGAVGARGAPRVVEERSDGAVVVELSFAGVDWLVREILKEAGDAAVLEPEDARKAVREASLRLTEAQAKPVRDARRAGRSCSRHDSLQAEWPRMNRREQIKMTAAEVAALPGARSAR